MKKYRPAAVFSPDPGAKWEQWHKTDHRIAASITKDAFIASEWHLYYPQHLLDEGLKPYPVPLAYYYYSHEPNYQVDITEVVDLKVKAASAHVSQFPPAVDKYTPDLPDIVVQGIRSHLAEASKEGDRYYERFRREEAP